MSNFTDDLDDLETPDDVLRFFHVADDQRAPSADRLRILRRFHDYLSADAGLEGLDDEGMSSRHRAHLERAYQDFIVSNVIAGKTAKPREDSGLVSMPVG